MKRLVDDLLDVSRITQGKIQLRLEPVDVETVVASAVETSAPAINAQSHQLRVTLPDSALFVNGDASRLTQVVANLLTNAAKYQNENGTIDLGVRRVRLLTNNPQKIGGLESYGIDVVARAPLEVAPHPGNIEYLRTKQAKLGHLLSGLQRKS